MHEKIKLVKSLVKWGVGMQKLWENSISGYQLSADGERLTGEQQHLC